MANTRYIMITLIIIIIILSSSFYFYNNIHNNKKVMEKNLNETVEVPLGPGSQVKIFFKSRIPTSNGTLTTQERNATLTIDSYQWPLVLVTYNVSNQTGNITPAYTLIEVPKNFVGEKSFNAPVAVPLVGEGLCARFNLTKKTDRSYVYESTIDINNYVIKINYIINENGIITNSTYIFYEKSYNQNNINITQYINVSVIKISNTPYKVTFNKSKWFCDPPISGDLRFAWDGILLIEPGYKARTVSLSEFRRAIQGGAYVAFLDKGCPHCQRTWPHLLAAVNETGTKVYAVIFGNLLNKTAYNYFVTLMNSNGLTGFPSIVYFKNGYVPGPQYKLVGEVDKTQILVNFLSNKK